MAYVGPYWQNKPSTSSPINAANLEIMDGGITNNDKQITAIKHNEEVVYKIPCVITEDYYIKSNGTIVSSAGLASHKAYGTFDVSGIQGQVIKVETYVTGTSMYLAFYDSNDAVISGTTKWISPDAITPFILDIPNNAYNLKVSCNLSNTESLNGFYFYKEKFVQNEVISKNSTVILNDTQEKTTVVNIYNPNDPDVETGGFYNYRNEWTSNANFMETGYIPVAPGFCYRANTWTSADPQMVILFFDENKAFKNSIVSEPNGYVQIPDRISYIRFPVSLSYRYTTAFYKTKVVLPFVEYGKSLIFGEDGIFQGDISIVEMSNNINNLKDFHNMLPDDDSATGILLDDGTINTSFTSIHISKYTTLEKGIYYLNGTGGFSTGAHFCYLWRVKNGAMVDCIKVTSNPQTFNHVPIVVDDNVDEIWIHRSVSIILQEVTAKDKVARDMIAEGGIIGAQWNGKTWYAYGTSITSVHQGTGKYPTYLAAMSGMNLVEKGIGGQGIGTWGWSGNTGAVYDAICNITDGKLDADLITLETGANDISNDTPLGTIYDTGRSTLAGCLNDCLRYLQANTNAQVAVTFSPQSTSAITEKYFTWMQMVEQICKLNRVHYMNPDNNMGYAKLTDATKGSLYIVDNIHQTNLGGYIMAENLWYQLRNIPLFYTAIPQ